MAPKLLLLDVRETELDLNAIHWVPLLDSIEGYLILKDLLLSIFNTAAFRVQDWFAVDRNHNVLTEKPLHHQLLVPVLAALGLFSTEKSQRKRAIIQHGVWLIKQLMVVAKVVYNGRKN